MYDFVRPDKVMCALQWLKLNNTLYSNVDINDTWMVDSLDNNDELFTTLTEGNSYSN